jgi:uncharacterized protein YndB with AHSA1/START domain
MRFALFAAAVAAAFLCPRAARAEVAQASPGSVTIHAEANLQRSPDRAWAALTQIGRWWDDAHTYSGDSAHMRLDARAGGCWCERWGGQSVEHMRVISVFEHEGVRTLRLVGGLGPLQEMPVYGVLTWTVAPQDGGARLVLDYRVSGESGLNLGEMGPLVDQVIMEQFGRLSRYTVSGSPD